MKAVTALFSKLIKAQKTTRKTIKEYQQELLIKQTADQFKKLMKMGQMPVTFL